jgi:hypothetical protein
MNPLGSFAAPVHTILLQKCNNGVAIRRSKKFAYSCGYALRKLTGRWFLGCHEGT